MSAGSHRLRATFWLLDAPDSLRAQSHHNPDGTGLGTYDEHDRPVVDKQPLSAFHDPEFARAARHVTSTTFVAHVRFASTGAHTYENTHPFELDGRLFAHNGVIGDLPKLEAHLGDDRDLVKGDTDSERLFALITRETRARDGDVRAGIVAAMRWVARELPVFAANIVLTTDRELYALRYPDTHDLYLLERSNDGPLHHRSHLGTHVHSEHAAELPVVVVATEHMDDDPAWSDLASGELVVVNDRLEITRSRVIEHPPAHPLTLADLDEHARASQAGGPPAPGATSSASSSPPS